MLLDRFAMCHELDLTERLDGGELTLPLADLLLTKLQVVRLNKKDVLDLFALLGDHDFGSDDIDLGRILAVTRGDWGFEHTIDGTLGTLRERLPESGLPADVRGRIAARVDELDARSPRRPRARAGGCAPASASACAGTRSPRRRGPDARYAATRRAAPDSSSAVRS